MTHIAIQLTTLTNQEFTELLNTYDIRRIGRSFGSQFSDLDIQLQTEVNKSLFKRIQLSELQGISKTAIASIITEVLMDAKLNNVIDVNDERQVLNGYSRNKRNYRKRSRDSKLR